ncbi:MAG TPA: hypothetical protein VH701_18705, partial [Vicinamibacterales bacterium]
FLNVRIVRVVLTFGSFDMVRIVLGSGRDGTWPNDPNVPNDPRTFRTIRTYVERSERSERWNVPRTIRTIRTPRTFRTIYNLSRVPLPRRLDAPRFRVDPLRLYTAAVAWRVPVPPAAPKA